MTAESLSIPAESLLRHRAFVRALARSLVRDEHAAEDLVQETWLAALRHPPRSAAALPAWLARVVRTRAQNAARGEARRASREAIAAREEADESEERLREHVATQQKVVAAVLGLNEPYRTVVLLRYYEGLSPAAIAVRRGMPEGTIRAQLSRAHDLLRERLDAEFGGSRKAWSVILSEMTRPSVALLLSMKTVAAITSVAAAVIVGILLFAPHEGRGTGAVSVRATSGIDTGPSNGSQGLAADPSQSARTEIASEEEQPNKKQVVATLEWTLRGTVVDSEGRSVAQALLGLFARPVLGAPPVLEQQIRTDVEGTFHIPLASGADRLLSVVQPGAIPPTVPVTFGDSRDLDLGTLRLAPGDSLSGTVIDAFTGAGLGTAKIILVNQEGGAYSRCGPGGLAWVDDHFVFASLETATDVSGRFSIDGLEKGVYRLNAYPPKFRCSLAGVEGDEFRVRAPSKDLRLEFRAPRLVFTVTSMGRAVPRATIGLRRTTEGPASQPMTCSTEDDGYAVVAVPEAISLEVEVGAAGFASRRYAIEAPNAGQVLAQNVELDPGQAPGRLELQIADAPGPPVETISLGFFDVERPNEESPVFTRDAVKRSKSGSFEIADLPANRYGVDLRVTKQWGYCHDTCYVPRHFEVDIRPRETVRVRETLMLGGRVRVRVRNGAGESLDAGVTFKDSAAAPVSVTFVQFDPNANMMYMSTWQPHVSRAHPEQFVNLQPAFAEGTYSVEVKMDGFAGKSETFRVDKGEVTDLDFTLESVRR